MSIFKEQAVTPGIIPPGMTVQNSVTVNEVKGKGGFIDKIKPLLFPVLIVVVLIIVLSATDKTDYRARALAKARAAKRRKAKMKTS